MDNPKRFEPRPDAAPAVPSVRRGQPMRMYRFLILFGVCMVLGFVLLFAPPMQPAVNGYTTGLVIVAANLIHLFGGQAVALGDLLQNPLSHFAIKMANGCNGAHVTILLWAAVLAFPASWAQKGKGLLAGTAAIHIVNLIRFISLFYIGQYSQPWFDFAHMYLWESLMMLDTLVVFWAWAYLVRKSGSMADATVS